MAQNKPLPGEELTQERAKVGQPPIVPRRLATGAPARMPAWSCAARP